MPISVALASTRLVVSARTCAVDLSERRHVSRPTIVYYYQTVFQEKFLLHKDEEGSWLLTELQP